MLEQFCTGLFLLHYYTITRPLESWPKLRLKKSCSSFSWVSNFTSVQSPPVLCSMGIDSSVPTSYTLSSLGSQVASWEKWKERNWYKSGRDIWQENTNGKVKAQSSVTVRAEKQWWGREVSTSGHCEMRTAWAFIAWALDRRAGADMVCN